MGFVGMWCADIICRDVVHRVPTIIRWHRVPTNVTTNWQYSVQYMLQCGSFHPDCGRFCHGNGFAMQMGCCFRGRIG